MATVEKPRMTKHIIMGWKTKERQNCDLIVLQLMEGFHVDDRHHRSCGIPEDRDWWEGLKLQL